MKKFSFIVFILIIHSISHAESKKIVYGLSIIGNESIPAYAELTAYLGKKFNQKFEPVFEAERSSVSRMVALKEAEFGLLHSGPYVIGKEKYGLEILVAVNSSFGKTCKSYVIVPSDSPAMSLIDLKNKSFGFVSLHAYTGRLLPLYMILKSGYDPLSFFSKVSYFNYHASSIYAVADKKVDGAAVMSIVFDYICLNYPETAKKIKIISKSENAGPPVFVISKHAEPWFKEKARKVLLDMLGDETGKKILKKLHIDSFYLPKESEFDGIKTQVQALEKYLP